MAPLCVSAPTNQHHVCSNPQLIILQGSAFKVPHPWISQLSAELRPSSTSSPPSGFSASPVPLLSGFLSITSIGSRGKTTLIPILRRSFKFMSFSAFMSSSGV
ncbi:hypothetical protein AMECASPLE_019205 [Ameca splendens]|uniref:Uncharacterized protein n=1 Tax=Ameca splendens TaxID=208324 RepID=A0ABV0YPV0_9TELE